MRWLCIFLLAACTDFEDVPRNVCGNGLLEPGEDCDVADPSCVRCAVACAVDSDCPTDAYACGVDGFCHAPGGELARPSAPVTFRADDVRITDIDHDGRGDVVGVSRTSLVVRYGDALGALTAVDSFVTPAQSGPASFGDLDGDGSLDVTLSTVDGLVTYTSAFATLSPLDVETPLVDDDTGESMEILGMRAIGPLAFVAFGVVDGVVIMLAYDFAFATEDLASFTVPCLNRIGTIPRATFSMDRVDFVTTHAPAAAQRSAVVSFATASGATCVLAIHGDTGTGYTFTEIAPANIGNHQRRLVLADIDHDNDPCPGLVSSDPGPGGFRYWDGSMSGARCALAATPTTLPPLQMAPPGMVAVGRIPISPRIPFFSADALVTTNGVYSLVLGQMAVMYQSSRPLASVAYGDVDGDGDIDGVATAATEDDLDILYRFDQGVELLRFDTASNVTSITIGDYDGNGIGDLAYTEAAINHEKMFVAYGTPDRHLPPLQVAAFPEVATVTKFSFRDSADNLSIADDLLVLLAPVGNSKPTATLLHGSPQRTMLSFLDPRMPNERSTSLVRGAVVGDFVSGDKSDLMVFASSTTGVRAYRVAGKANGLDTTPTPGTAADGLAECGFGSGVCVQTARYLAWPRQGTTDVVIAVDRRSATLVDPGQSSRAIPALVDGLPAGATIQSLHRYDVDGDGTHELIAAFTAGVRICDVGADGMPTKCDDVKSAIASSTTTCIDAAPGRIGERGVVVLCREGMTASLHRVTRTNGALAALELAQGVALRGVSVDDVTGDGVDDVVAVQGDGAASALVVFPQCTSRDLAACRTEGRSQ